MPLDADRLGSAIASAIATVPFPEDAQATDVSDFWKAVAGAIIDEIKDNAVVTSNGATAGHSPGAPAPITGLEGEIT